MSLCLPFDVVVEIHLRLAPGHTLVDAASLRSTLGRPMQGGFGQDEFFPSVVEKAAVLLHGLATTQPFSDGNKRVAWTCCVTFLRVNGMFIGAEVAQDDVVGFVLEIATNVHEPADVALQLIEWIE